MDIIPYYKAEILLINAIRNMYSKDDKFNDTTFTSSFFKIKCWGNTLVLAKVRSASSMPVKNHVEIFRMIIVWVLCHQK